MSEPSIQDLKEQIKQLKKDLDFCSGGWNVKTTIGSNVYEIMKEIRNKYNLGEGGFFNVPEPEYEWNLYHDMDNRSYHDVKKIKELEDKCKEEYDRGLRDGVDAINNCIGPGEL